MKLYYSPGACSLSVHIVLREGKFKFDIEKVDLAAKKTESGEDYLAVNPKGYVPALKLDDGAVLTEANVILQYLADQKPRRGLAPKPRTPERYKLMEWLTFTSSEIHKALGDFFNPRMTPEWREARLERLNKRFDFLEKALGGNEYLMGEFTIADAYLFNVLNWTHIHKIDMSGWPNIQSFMRRVAERTTVKKAMKAEGLGK
ncbi:MAG TPA: glutathione transferase GstA [Burkholderiales bacterium]|jgi:glutathione S-transferase|nr:glutathione transferase GstA [Burkholderiales bacterium]